MSFSFSSVRGLGRRPDQLPDLVGRAPADVDALGVDAEHARDLAPEGLEIPLLEVGLARARRSPRAS